MNTKFRKWKFASSRKIFLKEKKLFKWINKGDISIYDTRDLLSFNSKKLKGSENISPSKIKRTILKHNKKEKIILVGKELRTNATFASWARFKGYKKVYLIDKKITEIDLKKIK